MKTMMLAAVLSTFLVACAGETEAPESTEPAPTPAEVQQPAAPAASDVAELLPARGTSGLQPLAHDNPVF